MPPLLRPRRRPGTEEKGADGRGRGSSSGVRRRREDLGGEARVRTVGARRRRGGR
jgi:hypothetical protein